MGVGPSSSAIPLPGAAAPRSAAIPLPGSAAPPAAIALPPVPSDDPFSFDDVPPPAAYASPGVAAPRAISLDAGPAAPVALPDDSFSFDMDAPPQAAPMAAEDDFSEVGSGEFSSLDTSDFGEREDVTRVVKIPVPNAAFREPAAYGT
ncbi:hypothetical protein D7X74_42325, partial [Corallococcus sp. CA047B]